MGQWNTLHLLDENKLRNKIIPLIKGDSKFLEKYFDLALDKNLLDSVEISKKERIEIIMKIANQLTENFKVYPKLKKDKFKDRFYYSQELEDLRTVFYVIVFSECALAFPYFRLGYRLMSYIKYKNENSYIETLIDNIQYITFEKSIFPIEFGIRNWISNKSVLEILDNFDEVIPSFYTEEFRAFLTIAKENKFGLISCWDSELNIFKEIAPIGKNINWKNSNLEANLILKPM